MASLNQAKTLGGIGSLFTLFSGFLFWLPDFTGTALLIIGLVLMLVAVKNIADVVGDQSIFSNMMYSVILAIIGPIIAIVVVVAAAASVVGSLGGFVPGSTILPPAFLAVLGIIILAVIVLIVCIIVSTIFLKKSYDNIAVRLRVDMFKTAGLLFLIGAATLIVVVGILILFIAAILQVVAFFSIPDQVMPQMPPQQSWGPPPPPPPMPPSQIPTQ